MDLLEKMATYVRVVEAGSFAAAAKQLRLSAAAVSRQIAALEAELQVQLVQRTTRRMTITPAGRSYHESCTRILREVAEAQSIGRSQGMDGLLKVSAPVSFGIECVAPHIYSLMQAHPGLRIDLRLEDRIVDLSLEDVDVAIRVGSAPPDHASLVAHALLPFRRVLAAAPLYLLRRGNPLTPEALAEHDILTGTALHGVDAWVMRTKGREARVRMHARVRTNSMHALRSLALQGAGIISAPEWLVADALAESKLVRLLDTWEIDPVQVNAIHRVEHRRNPRVVALTKHLAQVYVKQGYFVHDAVVSRGKNS